MQVLREVSRWLTAVRPDGLDGHLRPRLRHFLTLVIVPVMYLLVEKLRLMFVKDRVVRLS